MKPIDTHAHLYHRQFDADRTEVMARAQAALQAVLLPNIDAESLPRMFELAAAYPGFAWPMVGLHPCHAGEDWAQVLAAMRPHLDRPGVVAVGETGIDLYWDKTTLPQQQQALREQLQWARETGLPIVLHVRDSYDETMALVEEYQDGRLRGEIHCFTGTADQARRAVAANLHLGLGGVLTYKTSDALREAARAVPLNRLLLETDCPYLPPVPHRGKRNESAYIPLVVQVLADVLEMPLEQVSRATSENAVRLFGLGTRNSG